MDCILDPTGFFDIDGKLQPGKNADEFPKKMKKVAAPLGVLAVLCNKKREKTNWVVINILFAPLYRFPFEFVVELVGKLVLDSSSSN